MKRKMLAGSTSVKIPIFVQDSSSTSGAGLSVAYNAAGLVGEYRRDGQSSWTAMTLATATLGTFTSSGWVADGSLTGAVEVGIPNAALATGVPWVAIRYRGVTNMLPVLIEIELDAVDYQNATNFGLGAIPAVAIGSTGSIITSGTGTGRLTVSAGQVQVQAGTGSGQLSITSGVVNANTVQHLGTASATPDTAGYPKVTIKSGTGTGELSLSSGGVIISSAGLDNIVVETGMNARQALSAAASSAAGVLSGATTGTIVIKGAGVATTRITATTDDNGNRTAITLSLPA